MKKLKVSLLILFTASVFLEFLVGPIRGYLVLPGIQALEVCAAVDFLIYLLATWYFLYKYRTDFNPLKIIGLMLLGLILFEAPIRLFYFTETLFNVPESLMRILGIFAGYFCYERKTLLHKFSLSISVLLLIFTFFYGYDYWMKKLQYGNFTGEVYIKGPKFIDIRNKNNENINLKKGKLIVMDFWFVGCGSCMEEFPAFQKTYAKYKNNPAIQFYSVNQPFPADKGIDRFKMLKDLGYNFPMAISPDRTLANELQVAVYPTVIMLDKDGNVVYKGDAASLEETLKQYL